MYANLKREMTVFNVTTVELADSLGCSRTTVSSKLNNGGFSIEEAFLIKTKFFPKFEMNYLFKRENLKGA